MKTKELIRLLQEQDPKNECEVVVDGDAIWCVHREPGYWDGPYCKLIEDENLKPYYSIIGVEYTRKGSKIFLDTMDYEDVIWDNPDAIFKIDGDFLEKDKKHILDDVEKIRTEVRKMKKEMDDEKRGTNQSNDTNGNE